MSIRIKLFLAILAATLILVCAMYGFMQWSLNKGFSDFMEKRHQERLSNLIDGLGEYYLAHQSWNGLIGNKKQWLDILWQANPRHHRPPREMLPALAGPADEWPPTPPPEQPLATRFVPFELRIMLLNSDKSLIFGRKNQINELTLHPIMVDRRIAGYLGVLPGKPVSQLGEVQFLEKQGQALVWIALFMILVSAMLALLLAYLLGRPLKRITATVNLLAAGRYDQRLPVASKDELGRLAQDFNGLAATLEQTEQSRRRWIADISHELRTPLAVLRAELEALQDGIRPLTGEAVDSLMNDVIRLQRLTDDLYQLALSDQGALTYHKTQVEPVELLQHNLNSLKQESDHKNIAIDFTSRIPAKIFIHADPDRLSQLFRNLITNSINYTDPGGVLKITCSRLLDKLLVEFSDSAPGVSEHDMAKLFDRFYRVEASRSRFHGGAGLGLAICQNIVNAHHGRISASPSALGGLTIIIELPINP